MDLAQDWSLLFIQFRGDLTAGHETGGQQHEKLHRPSMFRSSASGDKQDPGGFSLIQPSWIILEHLPTSATCHFRQRHEVPAPLLCLSSPSCPPSFLPSHIPFCKLLDPFVIPPTLVSSTAWLSGLETCSSCLLAILLPPQTFSIFPFALQSYPRPKLIFSPFPLLFKSLGSVCVAVRRGKRGRVTSLQFGGSRGYPV